MLPTTQVKAQARDTNGESTDTLHIALKFATFDPLATEPPIPPALYASPSANDEYTYLVQFVGPVIDEWKATVQQSGARLYGYIPEYAFLARMDQTTAKAIEAFDMVRWVGPYHPAYRLAPGLADIAYTSAHTVTQMLTIETLPDANLDALEHDIVLLGGTVQQRTVNELHGYMHVLFPLHQMIHLAALNDVLWIEPLVMPTIRNNVAAGDIMNASDIRSDMDLYGAGQTIAIADTGLDKGKQSTLHPDVKGRLVKAYCLGRTSPCDWSDPAVHGTHVAGSVLGNGVTSGSTPGDHDYSNSYAGTAPEAQVVFQSVGDSQGQLGGLPTDRGDLMRQAYDDGARIHLDPWGGPTGQANDGSDTYGDYVLSSAMVDLAAWQNKDMLIIFPAGNGAVDGEKDGQGRRVGNGIVDNDSIDQPGTAKNVLTVGATENERTLIPDTWQTGWSGLFPSEPIASDKIANKRGGMAAFSGRGPTDDGRIKPDVVAPGTSIVSLRTREYIFYDNLESTTTPGRYTTDDVYGGTGMWQWITGDAYGGNHAWRQTITSSWAPSSATILFTPAMNIGPAGAAELTFWHTCSLSPVNEPALLIRGRSLKNPDTVITTKPYALDTLADNATCTKDKFSFVALDTLWSSDIASRFGIDPSQDIQFGFSIVGWSGIYNPGGTWTIDNLRVDGYKEARLSNVGMTEPDSTLDTSYVLSSGTSMAASLTAGAAALVREWLITKRGVETPSSALIKAVLLNGALHISPGQYGTGDTQEIPDIRPNMVSGWGRVDLVGSISAEQPRTIWFIDNTIGVKTARKEQYTLLIDATSSLNITLAWTDYPGEPGASRALVNDLDLAVVTPDQDVYRGNEGLYTSDDACLVNKYDACNNVESIFISDASAGVYRIIVSGVHVPSGEEETNSQPFALVLDGENVRGANIVSIPLVARPN